MKQDNPVTRYAKEVLSGNINACELVKLACSRHMNDLKKSKTKKFKYYFDEDKANRAIEFFSFLKHYKGEFAGHTIELEPWQKFRVGSVYGWIHKETGHRKYKIAYNQVPRKNGKSTEAAGIGIYMTGACGESGAEVYSAATKKDQAKIIFDCAQKMIKASPSLKKHFELMKTNISFPSTASKFEPLSSDANTLDGLNIFCGIIDEYHAHKNNEVYEVLTTATGARREPLLWIVTTAGFDTSRPCYEMYEYACKVLQGVIEDESFFAYIATIDKDDDVFDEKNWYKANPNLGVSCNIEDMRIKAKQARELPRAYNNFVVKHLNVWTNVYDSWMNMTKYDECEKHNMEFKIEDLDGKECYCGIDLSATTDLTSVTLEFALDNGKYAWIQKSFLPEDRIKIKEREDKVPYSVWIRAGWIIATPGETIDYDWVKDYILRMSKKYRIKEIDLDPWNASQFSNSMMSEGFECVEIRQGFKTMSEPIKDIEKLVLNKKLITFDNPVLKWAFSNAVASYDPAENIKLDKKKSTKRIDPVISGVNSHVRCMINDIEEDLSEHILNEEWSL